MKALLPCIVCIFTTCIACAINRPNSGDSKIIRYKYPEFLYVEDEDNWPEITLYNYDQDGDHFKVESFIPSGKNFGESTFYVKIEYDSNPTLTEEFFRVKRNLWKRIEHKQNEKSLQFLRVSKNIYISDTFLIIDRSNFNEMMKIYDYLNVRIQSTQ